MKKFPRLVQCDKRGQIVIPKEIRSDLNIEEGTGFFMYSISDEGILLKKVDAPELSEYDPNIMELSEKAEKISLDKNKLNKNLSCLLQNWYLKTLKFDTPNSDVDREIRADMDLMQKRKTIDLKIPGKVLNFEG